MTTFIPHEVVEYLNEHPDEAAELLPEVERYIVWKRSPFVHHFNGAPKFARSPRTFKTKNGRILSG